MMTCGTVPVVAGVSRPCRNSVRTKRTATREDGRQDCGRLRTRGASSLAIVAVVPDRGRYIPAARDRGRPAADSRTDRRVAERPGNGVMGHLGATLVTSPRAPPAPPLPASVVRRLRRGQVWTSKRSDGALPPGGSALGAVAEVHDTVAEPVFLQQLQLGAGVASECGLALTLIDQPGVERVCCEGRPSDGEVASRNSGQTSRTSSKRPTGHKVSDEGEDLVGGRGPFEPAVRVGHAAPQALRDRAWEQP